MTSDYDHSRVRAMSLEWCGTCERWFHRTAHNCVDWVRPVDWRILRDGMRD